MPLIAAAAACVLLSVSCSTLSTLPQPGSPDDCLIVLKSERKNLSSHTGFQGRRFSLELSHGLEPVYLPNGYAVFVVREPGVSVVGLSSTVGGRAKGEKSHHKMDMQLPYFPGHVVILPVAFVQTIRDAGPEMFMCHFEFRDLEAYERVELERELSKDPGFSRWVLRD